MVYQRDRERDSSVSRDFPQDVQGLLVGWFVEILSKEKS